MTKVQELLINMMIDLQNALDGSGIKYSASSGTVLGAFRHKGFIPWDDDVDYEIPLDDYFEALKILEAKLPNKYNVVYPEKNKNTSCQFAKVYDTSIKVEEEGYDNKKYGEFLFIDIFPVIKTFAPSIKRMNKPARKLGFKNGRTNSNALNFLKFIPSLFVNENRQRAKYNDFIKEVRDDNGDRWFTTWFGNKKCTSNNLLHNLDKTKMVSFENIKIPVWEENEKYLVSLYGSNYNQIPPKEKQINHKIKIKNA